MQAFELTPEDLEQIKAKNISKSTVEKQLRRFEKGFPFLDIIKLRMILVVSLPCPKRN